MHLSRSQPSSSPSSSSPFSMLLFPLLVSLALSSAFNPTLAAPTGGVKQVSLSVSSSAKGDANDAASRAAILSLPSSSSSNRLNVQNETVDLSPWSEVHQIALPKPDKNGKVNTTTVSNTMITTNITTPAGKMIVTNTTIPSTSNKTASVLLNEPLVVKKKTSSKSKKKTSSKTTSTSKSSTKTTVAAASSSQASGCSDTPTTSFPSLTNSSSKTSSSSKSGSCFPALDFTMPSGVPDSLDGWWCDPTDEYAFMGFSYGIDACQSQAKLTREFKDARQTYKARYVRLYGVCDDAGFYDRVVEAAWDAGIGVQALIWFGFDGSQTLYKTRRTALFNSLQNNDKAKFVTRAVQFGSEPLFDWAISGTDLATNVTAAKKSLSGLGINVTVSEMAYGYQYQASSGSADVLKSIDFIDAHMLPYFAQNATTGDRAWGNNNVDMNYFLSKAPNKKIYWSQTGWPSTHDCNAGVCPNSAKAVSSVANEKAYFDLLDAKCTTMKSFPQGGVGWFAHMYSDSQGPGYGILDTSGKAKFTFQPKTSC